MWPFSRSRRLKTKGVRSFEGMDRFVGDGTNPAFGTYLDTTEELWGKPSAVQLEKIANTHAVARRCVEVTATSLLEAPLKKGRATRDGWEDAPDDDADLLRMRKPNPTNRFDEFVLREVANRQATGLALTWIWRDKAGLPSELWPIPTSWAEMVPLQKIDEDSARRTVGEWIVRIPGHAAEVHVEPEDMLEWRVPDSRSFDGMASPLASAWRNVMMDVVVGDYSAEMYRNNRSPGLIFKQKAGFTESQKSAIRALFNDLFGSGRRGRPLFLGGEGSDIQQFPALGDLGYPNATSLNETRVCMALGVPPVLVGCWSGLQNSPWSNIGEARRIFAYYTLVPMWNQLGALLTELYAGDEGWEFYFDTAQVQALQDDQTSVAGRAAQLLGGGAITRNEAREMVGQAPNEARGNVFLMPMALQEVPADEAPAEEEPPEAGPPPGENPFAEAAAKKPPSAEEKPEAEAEAAMTEEGAA